MVRSKILPALAAMAVLASCAPGMRGDDKSASPNEDAPTFVSLNPCLDAILVEVAAPGQVLALSHYSRDPSASSMDVERAREYGVTGGTAEEVLALGPDIVLASSFIAPATKAAFERLGLRVETFGSPLTPEGSADQIQRLGLLTGDKDRTEALLNALKLESRAQADLPASAPSATLWQPGQIVPGEQTLISALLRESGFRSHSAELGLGQGDYVSLEMTIANPPDVLFVAGDSAGQAHPALRALKNTHIERFDTNMLFCGGPSIPRVREFLVGARTRWQSERRP